MENPEILSDVLLYHVVPGLFLIDDLTNGQSLTTVAGTDVVISRGDALRVNQSTVIAGGFVSLNGVIHALDSVLLPPGFISPTDIVNTATGAGNFIALIAAVEAAGLTETLMSSGPFTVCKS